MNTEQQRFETFRDALEARPKTSYRASRDTANAIEDAMDAIETAFDVYGVRHSNTDPAHVLAAALFTYALRSDQSLVHEVATLGVDVTGLLR